MKIVNWYWEVNLSIIITNDGGNTSPRVEHGYVIRINHDVITTFKHTREEGLAECLRRAADAVEATEVLKPIDHTTRIYNGK